ncbi:MAG: hypothetical protein IKV30_01880 [Clostridia bacterium]|nr:hypothetical protein [Clostridia bacterium]
MNKNRIITIILTVALLVSAIITPMMATADVTENTLVRNVVYIYNMSVDEIKNIDVEGLKLTHINYSFVYVSEDYEGNLGYITTDKGQTDLFNSSYYMGYKAKQQLKALVELKDKYPWLSICVSIGGGDMEQKAAFAKLATDEVAIERFAANVRKLLVDYKLDGVDLDWEVPEDRKEMKAYVKMAQALRAQLGPDAVITSAVPCDTTFTELFTKAMARDFNEALSFWNIMTYDLGNVGKWEFIAPLDFIVQEGETYAEHIKLGWGSVRDGIKNIADLGVPYENMVIGLAYFGLVNTDITSGHTEIPHGQYVDGNGTKPYYETIAEYLKDPTWVRLWNDVAQCPYLIQKNSQGQITGYITYDDADAIKAKLDFAKELGISGAMCWTLNGDDDNYTLAKATASHISDAALEQERGKISESAPTPTPEATATPEPQATAEPTATPSANTNNEPAKFNALPLIIGGVTVVAIAVVLVVVLKKKK